MPDQVLPLLLESRRVFITTHVRPDGDALGSQLALGRFLRKLGKEVAMINNDPPPYNLGWLPGADEVEVFDGSLRQRELIDAADLVAIVDTNAIDRLGRLSAPVQHASGRKILIDHHPRPENWFDARFVVESAASTGELIYDLIAAHDAAHVDPEIATTLYTAIMTDTGSFRYSNVTPRLHRIVAELLERGDLSPAPLHTAVYDTRSLQGLRLLSRALESITLHFGNQVGYMVISQRMLRDTGAGSDDTEGLVNYVLSVEGVKAAVLFYEVDSGTKMSFRSKAELAVNDWARAFGGGGHRNAAGAFVERGLDETIDAVMTAAPRYLDLDPYEAESGHELSPDDASYLSSLLEMRAKSGGRGR